ncbi:hypothetical protein [Cytobacillus firmus]|uniref:Uncharacterized protein n=1 Tax=Cytobacillus firmus TaxID=1399 RepID=A0AA46Q6I2_CYTFI|nr:hypothetical protein [Cytobacillus firmus]MCM3708799.1 hypothetical protein [Cytobacillus firmus]UYG98249.1 hypothetical protein OD459_25605 [Cytobacillus firmus]
MDYYNYELIIKTKQQEIERMSNEAWKFANSNEESIFIKLVTKFSSVKEASEPSKQNQCVCICEC